MCGRYTLAHPDYVRLGKQFELFAPVELEPRYNIAPTQDVAVVRQLPGAPGRELAMLRWGLVPFWAKDEKIGAKMINARAETIASKSPFKEAFAKRRCLIPADGFYEWEKIGKRRQPYLIRRKGGETFAFAGLWAKWRHPEGRTLHSCTILTTRANQRVSPLHDRMPVILDPAAYADWLNPELESPLALEALLAPYPDEALELFPVSPEVGKPDFDEPRCIEPITVAVDQPASQAAAGTPDREPARTRGRAPAARKAPPAQNLELFPAPKPDPAEG